MLDPVFPGVGQRSVARQSPGGGMWATVGRYGRLGHAGFADKSSPQRYVTEQLDVVDAVLTRPVCCDPDTCTCLRRISDTCRTRQIQKAKKSAGANLLTLDLLGSPTWTRTRDLRINSPSLYRLSYQGTASNYSVILASFGRRFAFRGNFLYRLCRAARVSQRQATQPPAPCATSDLWWCTAERPSFQER